MGTPSINPNHPSVVTTGQYDALLQKADLERATEGKGSEGSKIVNNLGGDAVVYSKLPQSPTDFVSNLLKQKINPADAAKLPQDYSKALDNLEGKIQEFMSKYGLTREECLNCLQVAMENVKAYGSYDSPETKELILKGAKAAQNANSAKDTNSTPVRSSYSSSRSAIMFDLYAVLQLLAQVAQRQRNAAREIRSSQSTLVQQAIMDQADEQRFAACVGLVFGILSFTISLCMLLKNASNMKDGMKMEKNLKAEQGIPQAKMELKLAQNEAKSVQNAQQSLTHAEAKLEAQLGEAGATSFKQQFAHGLDQKTMDAKANVDNAKTTVDSARKELGTAQQEYTTARSSDQAAAKKMDNYLKTEGEIKSNEAELGKVKGEIESLNKDLAALKENPPESDLGAKGGAERKPNDMIELEDLSDDQRSTGPESVRDENSIDLDLEDVNQKGDMGLSKADQALAEKQEKLAQLQERQTQLEESIQTGKDSLAQQKKDLEGTDVFKKYNTTLEKSEGLANAHEDLSKAQGDYKAARDASIKDLESQVKANPSDKDLQAKLGYAKAAAKFEDVYSNGGAGKLDRLKSAQDDFNSKMSILQSDSRMKEATRLQDLQGQGTMTANMISQLMGTLGQTFQGLANAEATAKGADIKRAEEELEQAKDLFKQYQDVLSSVLSATRSIQQAESQSLQGILRA